MKEGFIMRSFSLAAVLTLVGCTSLSLTTQASELQSGLDAIKSMQGCYLVDYSYTETEALKPGYTRDSRVYDVSSDKSVIEWIYADQISPSRVRLQHVMFATDLEGKLMDGSQLKHTGEDWEFQAPFMYEFTNTNTWNVKDISSTSAGQWTRRVTNLDDGLRYQCTAPWKVSNVAAGGTSEWACGGYSPIPGRESRDMGRRDYDGLDRVTRILTYGDSFLERQANTKVIQRGGAAKENLAKELGKNWYVRLPDSQCAPAQAFVAPRKEFWNLVRESWDEVLVGDRDFLEKPAAPGRPSRYFRMMELEREALKENLSDKSVRASYKARIHQMITEFRAN